MWSLARLPFTESQNAQLKLDIDNHKPAKDNLTKPWFTVPGEEHAGRNKHDILVEPMAVEHICWLDTLGLNCTLRSLNVSPVLKEATDGTLETYMQRRLLVQTRGLSLQKRYEKAGVYALCAQRSCDRTTAALERTGNRGGVSKFEQSTFWC